MRVEQVIWFLPKSKSGMKCSRLKSFCLHGATDSEWTTTVLLMNLVMRVQVLKTDRLYSYCYQGSVPFYELKALCCSNRDKKLWYAGIMLAVKYDNKHRFVSPGGEPNMLYSLIRNYPNNLKGV